MYSSVYPEPRYQIRQFVIIWTQSGCLFWGPIRAIYLYSREYLVACYGDEEPGEVFEEEDILLALDLEDVSL